MNFFINKNSNLPTLRLSLVKDGRYDYGDFFDKIQNADIRFSMYDLDTGRIKICNKKCFCELKDICSDCDEEYFIIYKWGDKDTKEVGTFVGEITITFLDNNEKLIVPIREELFIHIKEGSIKNKR